jgi:hypothetical protein
MKVWTAGGVALAGAVLGALLTWHFIAHDADDDDDAKPTTAAQNAQPLTLDAATQAAAGIEIASVMAAHGGLVRSGYARAIDISPLAALTADAEAARVALAASQKEVARLTALVGEDQSAAPKELEAAQAQLAADSTKRTLACQKIGLDFGAGLARLGCDQVSDLVRDAAEGKAALVRVDLMQGDPPPTGANVMIGEDDDALSAKILGPAIDVDAQLQTPGALALVRGAGVARLAVGRMLPAHLPDTQDVQGILIPRSALMRADGGQFVYRAGEEGHFMRVALTGGVPMAGGWFFANSTLEPGTPIVIAGATALLGLERGPQQTDEEDDDD